MLQNLKITIDNYKKDVLADAFSLHTLGRGESIALFLSTQFFIIILMSNQYMTKVFRAIPSPLGGEG